MPLALLGPLIVAVVGLRLNLVERDFAARPPLAEALKGGGGVEHLGKGWGRDRGRSWQIVADRGRSCTAP